MAVIESTLGSDHPSYSMNLNNLAVLLQERVRAEECMLVLFRVFLVSPRGII